MVLVATEPGRLFLAVVGLLSVSAPALAQATIHVPDDQPTIQAGIDAASAGDTVLVAPGTYTESAVSFGGKAITVKSSGGAAATTVQAGQGQARTFVFNSGEGADSVLEGFTITRGDPLAVGGVEITGGATPTITDCRFTGNHTTVGGALRILGSGADVSGCQFDGNTASSLAAAAFVGTGSTVSFTDCSFTANKIDSESGVAHGGAVVVRNSTATLANCAFVHNCAGDWLADDPFVTQVGGSGGAVYADQGGVVDVHACRFEGNVAGNGTDEPGAGGAIAAVGSQVTVTNSVFARNLAGVASSPSTVTPVGSAIDGVTSGNPSTIDLLNCTFHDNGAIGAGADNAAISVGDGAFVTVRNTIVWASVSGSIQTGTGTPTVSYSIVEGGHAGIGNFHSDPMLSGDQRLLSGSPAIHAGDPDVSGLPATDLEGDPRVLGPAVDIGADEFRGAEVVPYGCGVNPAGSLTVLAGAPTIGTTVVFGVDNPLGTQSPGAAALLVVSLAPDPAFPCGTPVPGFGMAGGGAAGELLLALPARGVLQNALWAGPGAPAPVLLPIPDLPSLGGLSAFVQGVLVDLSPGADPVIGLTDALHLVIGL